MKIIRSFLKSISILFMFLITLQSCVVYHTETASVDEALRSNNKVKVVTTSNDIYKFEKLHKENNEIYGVTKKNSSVAKKLYSKPIPKENKIQYVNVLLTEETIKEFYLKNQNLSIALTIIISVVGAAAILLGVSMMSMESKALL